MTDWWPDSLEGAQYRTSATLSPETTTPGVTVWIDTYVEAWAEAFDSVSLGLGDVLRDFYRDCLGGGDG